MRQDEVLWLERARRGDPHAFGRLVDAYQSAVYNLAYRMLGNAPEAEDAAQEAFVRAYTKLHTYQPERSFSSWLLSIASHYCIDRLRSRRPAWLSLDDEPMETTLPSREIPPEETAIARERQDEVQQMVDALPHGYRVPVILHYWYGLSYAEIAEIMSLSIQAVKSRLHRARLMLADRSAARLRQLPWHRRGDHASAIQPPHVIGP